MKRAVVNRKVLRTTQTDRKHTLKIFMKALRVALSAHFLYMVRKLLCHQSVPAAVAELSEPPALGWVGLSRGPGSPAAVGPVVSGKKAQRLSLGQSAAAHPAPPAELPGCCSPEIPPEGTENRNMSVKKKRLTNMIHRIKLQTTNVRTWSTWRSLLVLFCLW